MRIRAGNGVGVRKKPVRTPCGIVAALMLGLGAAACTTTGGPSPTASTSRGPTVAFERIDGPPESVFRQLVQDLSDEAEARQLSVVSRAGPAQYRIRGYVAAVTQGKRSTITYVWDVYDAEQHRDLRITGEEPASAVGAGTWAVADDSVLRRVAHAGMDRLVAFLASPATEPELPAPADRAPAQTVAARTDDVAPVSAGIDRIAGGPVAVESRTAAMSAARTDGAAVPLPNPRPAGAGFAPQSSLAYLTPDR